MWILLNVNFHYLGTYLNDVEAWVDAQGCRTGGNGLVNYHLTCYVNHECTCSSWCGDVDCAVFGYHCCSSCINCINASSTGFGVRDEQNLLSALEGRSDTNYIVLLRSIWFYDVNLVGAIVVLRLFKPLYHLLARVKSRVTIGK